MWKQNEVSRNIIPEPPPRPEPEPEGFWLTENRLSTKKLPLPNSLVGSMGVKALMIFRVRDPGSMIAAGLRQCIWNVREWLLCEHHSEENLGYHQLIGPNCFACQVII